MCKGKKMGTYFIHNIACMYNKNILASLFYFLPKPPFSR